jgi:hypothetical protein
MTAEQIRIYASDIELIAMERGNWATQPAVEARYKADRTALERKKEHCRNAIKGARILKALAETPSAINALQGDDQ